MDEEDTDACEEFPPRTPPDDPVGVDGVFPRCIVAPIVALPLALLFAPTRAGTSVLVGPAM